MLRCPDCGNVAELDQWDVGGCPDAAWHVRLTVQHVVTGDKRHHETFADDLGAAREFIRSYLTVPEDRIWQCVIRFERLILACNACGAMVAPVEVGSQMALFE